LLKEHHIKLLPSLSEGFSLALPEAMACGLAPVTTATAGPMEIVQDGYNGLLVPVANSKAIENALEKLILNQSYLNELRRNAYTSAQRYSWSRIAKERLAIYEEALARKRRAQ
jgi:glycosyltransferase involved in cell wall biosynthesis